MTIKKVALNQDKLNKIVSDARKTQAEFEQSYRGQALKMYPWICGRCAREFTHTNLAELTVHHRNHNHDDNPADGSNWELLCLYCHDNEHQRYEEAQHTSAKNSSTNAPLGSHNPFANLKSMLESKK